MAGEQQTTEQTTQQTTQQTQAPATKWYEGKAAPEVVGYLQNKGLADKTPEEVALTVINSHREAEKFIGAPASELVRIPKPDADEATLKAYRERIGVPPDKTGYDFSSIKGADGNPLASPTLDRVRDIVAEAHLPKDAATRIAAGIVKFEQEREANILAEKTGKLTEQKAALAKNWGANFEVNKIVAQSAAAKLGVDPETVTALEGVIGYDKVMEMFRAIGSKMGEDTFVRPPGAPGTEGVMSVDAAKARIEELKSDTAWRDRYLNGGAEEKRVMAGLVAIVTGGQ